MGLLMLKDLQKLKGCRIVRLSQILKLSQRMIQKLKGWLNLKDSNLLKMI